MDYRKYGFGSDSLQTTFPPMRYMFLFIAVLGAGVALVMLSQEVNSAREDLEPIVGHTRGDEFQEENRTTWYVDDAAPDGGNGSLEDPFNKIQDAIDNADDGNTIYIYKGIYKGSFCISKSLTITGENKTRTTIDGEGAKCIIRITADDVVVENLTIQDSSEDGVGVLIQTNNVTVERTMIEQNGDGILVQRGDEIILNNNEIENNERGIVVGNGVENIKITENNITKNNEGIVIVNTTGVPSERRGPAIAFDSKRNQILMFGGKFEKDGNIFYLNETWIFDIKTQSYSQLLCDIAPVPSTTGGMVYLEDLDVFMLFGGETSDEREPNERKDTNETWYFFPKNQTWIKQDLPLSPPVRTHVRLTLDHHHEQVYMYGGHKKDGEPTSYLDDTWVYDFLSGEWSELEPATTPEGLLGGGLVCNKEYNSLIWFGGRQESDGKNVNDVWGYDIASNEWKKIETIDAPLPMRYFSMYLDEKNSKVIVFGGYDGDSGLNSTYEYNYINNEWKELSPAAFPETRWLSSCVYIGNGKGFLFGGKYAIDKAFNDIWLYDYTENEWTCLDNRMGDRKIPYCTIQYNNLEGNRICGINNRLSHGFPINASYNYWGNETGPHHATQNPDGLGDNVTEGVEFAPWLVTPNNNQKLPAEILSILPNPVIVGKTATFTGKVNDSYGEAVRYVWHSSIDGELFNDTASSFNYDSLSPGTHNISFKVMDDDGDWSDEVRTILIVHHRPKATIISITPRLVSSGKSVVFSGEGSDDGTIERYAWTSSIDGEIDNGSSSQFSTSQLSSGNHTIALRVQDNLGAWSENVYMVLMVNGVPEAHILSIVPNPGRSDEFVTFLGGGTDDGTILCYAWWSSRDGELYNGTDSSFSAMALSVGNHTITLKVQDNHEVWSNEVGSLLTISDPMEDAPDLYLGVSDIHFKSQVFRDKTTIISAFIHNNGPKAAEGTINFYHSRIGKETLIGYYNLSVPQESMNLAIMDWTPTNATEYTIIVVISDVRPADSNNDNNIASKKVKVKEQSSAPSIDAVIDTIDSPIAVIIIFAFASFVLSLAATDIGRFRLFSLFVVPFYTRLTKKDIEKDIKQQNIRGRVFQYVHDHPGASFTEIKNAIEISNGQSSYHLHVLEREGFLRSIREGSLKKFYTRNSRFPLRKYPHSNRLNRTQKRIIDLLYTSPYITQNKISQEINTTPQSVSYNVSELERRGMIKTEQQGFRKFCSLEDHYLAYMNNPHNKSSFLRQCPQCHSEIPITFPFCNNCGYKLFRQNEN